MGQLKRLVKVHRSDALSESSTWVERKVLSNQTVHRFWLFISSFTSIVSRKLKYTTLKLGTLMKNQLMYALNNKIFEC